ncbi:hypothetical protein D1007_44625 [Hordeum vulgare]|nr:hypothetical protein D1007_44625 [Hordeum vulgare]
MAIAKAWTMFEILRSHRGLVRGLSTGKFHSSAKDRAKLDEWLRSPALDQLKELIFNDGHMRLLLTSALSLRPPTPRQVHEQPFPLNETSVLFVPRLRNLEIIVVYIPKEDIERLLRGCTALEYLCIHAINGLSSFHITSITLCTIYVCLWCCNKRSQKVYHSMVTKDIPPLEILLVVDQQGPTTINVISMPRLVMVGYSPAKYSKVVIGSTPVQRRFMELSVMYTNNPVWVEQSILIMELFLAEEKYKGVGFDLEYTRACFGSRPKVTVAQMCVRNHVLVYHYCLATRPYERFAWFVNSSHYMLAMVDITNDVKVLKIQASPARILSASRANTLVHLAEAIIDPYYKDIKDSCNKEKCSWHSAWME